MKEFPYDLLRTAKIKSAIAALLLTLVEALTIYEFYRHAELVASFSFPVTFFLMIIPMVILWFVVLLVPFEKILSRVDRERFLTYYHLGAWKFKSNEYHYGGDVFLEQAKDRYYCLTIRLKDGQSLVIERIATRDIADRRLEDLRMLFV